MSSTKSVGNKTKVGLIKFGALEHMQAFYEKGEMYFNSFKFFKDLESSADGRSDKNEYASVHYSGDYLKKYIKLELKEQKSGTVIPLSADTGLLSLTLDYENDKEYSHLYSMSYIDKSWTLENDLIIDTRNFAENKDYAVLIYDFQGFVNKVIDKVRELNLSCKAQCVEYVNKNSYSGEMGPFRKFDNYQYQNEFRFAINFGTLEPQKIFLGSLEGIASKPMNYEDFYKVSCVFQLEENGIITKREITNKKAFV